MITFASIAGAVASLISAAIACMGGCVGGCVKPPPTIITEKLSKKQRVTRRGGRTHPPKDWWSSTSNEMENHVNNPGSTPRSTSAVSTPNRSQDGLMLWIEQRREWVGNQPRNRTHQSQDPVISWSTTYEDLLATSRPFAQPVPLPEMVDFLVEVWEQEGLYE